MQADTLTGEPVLLYPEGVLPLDEPTRDILALCDGTLTAAQMIESLAKTYDVDHATLHNEVSECLDQLHQRMLVVFGTTSPEKSRLSSTRRAARARNTSRSKKPPFKYRPYLLLAEVTHRCPLHCPYCSNPTSYPVGGELSTADWKRVLSEAGKLGILHVGFSGGEPLQRSDLVELVATARESGLYTNLITSAMGFTSRRAAELKRAGLDNVQISFQADEETLANKVAGVNVHAKKIEAARLARELGFPLTVNVVLHRANISRIGGIIGLAEELEAERLELANTQYYGWAFENRARLLPTRRQIEEASRITMEARQRLAGRMDLLFVVPDYYSTRPKSCMHGWGSRYLTVNPVGDVLPCPTANSIKGLTFDNVRDHTLEWIWTKSEAFNRFRGTQWMPLPCRECEFREVDFGGCRCQAALIAGDAFATDPACELSPFRSRMTDFVRRIEESKNSHGEEQLEGVLFRQNPSR